MTAQEAADELGLSRQTILVQIGRGKIVAEKHGRDWWIARPEVERYRRESLGRRGGSKT
jgi:excisionase family DNA binding protein